ncbi:DUF6194 family protein [Streptomyces sp. NPDC090741]|uniref:DUF6194 family protein n=1 Tax=Streptomyces sp. NPDC090741 TaxID=3365967 RepID=UPI0037FF5DD9
MAHPVYGSAGWLAVGNPGLRTDGTLCELLRHAHRLARARHERRRGRCPRKRVRAGAVSR